MKIKFSKICPVYFAVVFCLVLASNLFGQNRTETELLPIEENNLWGFIDAKGNVIIKPQFFTVSPFSDGLAAVQLEIGSFREISGGKKSYTPGRFGYIDKTGTVVLRVPYSSAEDFIDGLAPVRIGDTHDDKYYYPGKYGFIDKNGKLVVEPQYEHVINYFSEDLAAVKVGEKWGFIDKTRKIVIQPQFEAVSEFSEGLAAAKKGDKWGYIDRQGNFAVKPQFHRARNFRDGMAQINTKTYGDWGFIDKTGKIVIPTKYNRTNDFINGRAFVQEFQNNSFISHCINKTGENLPLEECQQQPQPQNYPVSKTVNGKKVFVDEAGNIVFENRWDYVLGFRGGAALVYNRNKDKFWCGLNVPGWIFITDACFHWGYIDASGKYLWKKPELK